jgi:hypothetical protein
MGWRGAGNNGASGTGTYFFFGGLLMLLGSLGEVSRLPVTTEAGTNTTTLTPEFNAYGAYSNDPNNLAEGINTVGFRSGFGTSPVLFLFLLPPPSFHPSLYSNTQDNQLTPHSHAAFFFISMGIMCLIYLVCSIRTNICFFMIFLTLVFAFACLTGAYLQANNGNLVLAGRLQIAGGAFAFVTCIFGWWIFAAIMLASLDFPIALPGEYNTSLEKDGREGNRRE